jgi:hypothetical protein
MAHIVDGPVQMVAVALLPTGTAAASVPLCLSGDKYDCNHDTGTASARIIAASLSAVAKRAAGLSEGARAMNTRRAYQSDWVHFEGWCLAQGLTPLPAVPATVGLYLAAHADALSVATLTRRLSSIATAHRLAEHSLDAKHPAIRDVMKGLRR